jgi:UDP-4-amino-4,6-dideoxy-N-acetyl-beta-L-altrosamine transaminase
MTLRPLRPLPYGRQLIEDDDIAAVVEQLKGDWLTQGPAVERFEKALCEITGAKFCVAVANGTAALHLASLAAGVRPGMTGVTSDITFVASANGIRYCGGESFLVDVEPETALISIPKLAERVDALARAGKAPKVIVPVDFAGTPADLPAVRAIADKIGALVIEDAAHSLGATYTHRGEVFRAAGCAHAHMAILSFHPVKHLTTGEGGAITTNDEALFRDLMDLRTHGITKDPKKLEKNDGPWYYEQHALGFNYRITDVQCALGISQAKKFPRFVARRRELAAMYDRVFAAPEWKGRVTPLRVPDGSTSAYHLYVVRVPKDKRKELFLKLRDEQIFAQVHYIPVHTQPDFRKSGLSTGEFPGATEYYESCISLPLYPGMADGDVTRVVSAVGRVV